MPAANQPLDTVLLKTAASAAPSDTLSKPASDSNTSKNSFGDVFNKERASADDRSQTRAAEDASSTRSKEIARREDRVEDSADIQKDGKHSAENGNSLPVEQAKGAADESVVELLVGVDKDNGEANDEGSSQDQEDSSLALEVDSQTLQPAIEATEATASAVAGVDAQTAARSVAVVAEETAASLQKSATSKRVAPALAAQAVTESSEQSQAAAKTPLADAMKPEMSQDIAAKQLNTGDFGKEQQRALENVKLSQAAALASTADAADSAKHQLRADAAHLTSQIAGAQKLDAGLARVLVPLNSPDWGQAVAQRVLWMANAGVQSAQLQLHPRELGPVDVRISMVNDQTQVQFSSQYSVVREALESSLPRLREMFEGNNLPVLDVNVSDQNLADADSRAQEQGVKRADGAENDEIEPLLAQQSADIKGVGIVDYYA